MPLNGILSGKKTYLVAALAILTFVVGYLDGDLDFAQAAQGVLTALMGVTVRSGMKTEIAKITDTSTPTNGAKP